MNIPGSPLAARVRQLAGVLVAALAGWLLGKTQVAAQIVWTGTTSGDWGTSTNWSSGVVPNSSTAVANFTSTVGQSSSITVNSTMSLGEIAFNATNSAAFTISGNTLDLFGTASSPFTAIADSANNMETIASNISVEHTQQWLQSSSTGNLVVSGNVDLGGQTLTINVTHTSLVSGLISDAGNLTKTGAGTLTLSNASNSYSGNTTISSGTLSIGSDADLGNTSATLTIAGTLLTTGNFSTVRNIVVSSGTISTSANTTLTINSNISPASSLFGYAKSGAGTLVLDGNNTNNGITVNAGTLTISADDNLGISTGGLTLNGGTIDSTSNLTTARTVTLGSLGGTISVNSGLNLTLTGTLAGSGSLTKAGTGILALNGTSSVVNFGLKLNTGTLMLGNSQMLSQAGLTMNGGILDFETLTSASIASLSGNSNISLVNDSATPIALTITAGNDATYSGNLSGIGASLTVLGDNPVNGSQTLTGTNTYTGGTVVSGGNLIISTANSLPSAGLVSIQGGNLATVSTTVSGLQITSGCVTSISSGNLTSLSSVDAQNGAINITLAGSSGLIKSTNGTVTLNNTNTFTGETDLENGTLVLSAASALQNSTLNFTGGNLTVNGGGLLGGLEGNQDFSLSVNLSVGNNNQNTTYSGNITGMAPLIKVGTGTLTLNGNESNGGIPSGGIIIDTGTVVLGNLLGLQDSGLTLSGGTLAFGNYTSAIFGNLSGNGTLNLVNSNSASLTLTVGNDIEDNTFSGNFTGTGALIKAGNDTLTLSGTNTYTGTTTISAGSLNLDFSQTSSPTNNIINSASHLSIDGSLDVVGSNSTTHTQTFATTTFMPAGLSLSLSGNSGTVNLNLGAITREVGATVNFTTNGNSTFSFLTSSGSANSILLSGSTPYATINGSDWAAKNGSDTAIVGLSTINGYVSSTASTLAGPNADIGAGVSTTLLSANDNLTSLRFNQNQNTTIDLGAHQLTVAGILQTSALAGVNTSAIANGSLAAGSGGELVVIQNSAQPLDINATIINSGTATSITEAGTGMLVLGGDNSFSGGTSIYSGTLALNNADALGVGCLTIANGTSLDNTSGQTITLGNNNAETWNGNFTFAGSNNLNLGLGAITLGQNMTLDANAATLVINGAIGDNGLGYTLTKSGNGTLTLGGANTFSGGLVLSSGTLNINSPTAIGVGVLNIADGTTIDNTSGNSLTLSGNNPEIWQGNLTFTGSNDLNLGTGNITLTQNAPFPPNEQYLAINSGNLTIGGSIGTNATLYFGLRKTGAGTLTLTGASTFPFTMEIDDGGLNLSGGTLQLTSFTASPYFNTVTPSQVVINNGGNLSTIQGAGFDIGSTLLIAGNGSSLSGGLNIVNGSEVTITNSATLAGGINFGNGTIITIANGGTVSGNIGSTYAPAGNDTVTITGPNSSILGGSYSFGPSTTGQTYSDNVNLTISNGGNVSGAQIGLNGTALVTDPGSKMVSSGELYVNGSNLTIVNGGTVISSGGASLTGGNVSISGVGSSWTLTNNLSFLGGENNITNGSVVVSNGGVINSQNVLINESYEMPSTYQLTVNSGAAWNASGDFLIASSENTSFNITVSNGSKIQSQDTDLGANFDPNEYGMAVDANVTGSGTSWETSNNLILGNSNTGGSANLAISNGATFIDGTAEVNSSNVTVSGAGSVWTTNGTLNIAGLSGGVFISNGAHVVDQDGLLAVTNSFNSFTSYNISLNISGAGSLWQNNGNISLQGGNGIVVNQADGTVLAGGSLFLGSMVNSPFEVASTGNNTYNLEGGTFEIGGVLSLGANTSTFNLQGGTLQIGGDNGIQWSNVTPALFTGNTSFVFAGGTIQVYGSDLTTCVNATLGDSTTSTIDTNGMNATWMGALSGTGNLAKIGNGTLALTGSNSYTGNTSVNAGTLAVTGSLAGGNNLTLGANTTLQVGATGTIAQGNVSLGGATNLTVNSLSQYSQITVANLLSYSGNLSLSLGSTLNYGIYNLFAAGSTSGDFLNVAITGLFSGALSDNSGVWSGTDSSQNFSFNDATGNLSVTGNNSAVASPSRQAWLNSNFSILQMADPSISGDSADPAGDGIPNLMKYALNLNPWVDGHAGIPQPTTDGTNLILSFTEYQSDVTYTVQASTDLVNWSTTGVNIAECNSLVTATYPLPPTGTAFLRLVVAPTP